jgi:hypothetical protein
MSEVLRGESAAKPFLQLLWRIDQLAFALYAFHTSLGGQPLFGRASLED